MERVLRIYELAYDPMFPVVCFDERPCFLIGDRVKILPCKPGSVKKEHYAYEKNGSANVLAMIEPLTGQRLVHVRRQRRAKEFTLFMENLAKQYPNAKKIRVVMDNLNTHSTSSFYKHLPADKAEWLARRFEFIYTPKGASWLNMIELEFSALSRQCLNRRIPTLNQLSHEVFSYFKERIEKKIKLSWQFTVWDARQKLNRHYSKVNPENIKLKI